MVRKGRRQYRKASQRGPNGGKTRSQQLREKLRRRNTRLSEKGLTDLRFHTKPITKHLDDREHLDEDCYPVYGIYKEQSEWVLTGFSVTDYREVAAADHRGGSTTNVSGRYVLSMSSHDFHPRKGMEIDRFETKKDAMQYVSADASEKFVKGAYVVRKKHNPRMRQETLDVSEFSDFKYHASKVWE